MTCKCVTPTGFAYSSGCSAILNVLSLIKPGDVVLAVDDVYGGTNCILKQYGEKFGIQTEFLDLCKLEHFEAALKPNTKVKISKPIQTEEGY